MENTPCTSDTRPNVARRNFLVNATTAMVLCAMIGTGILLEWVLPRGRGQGHGLVLWLGQSRHTWAEVHFWLASSLVALLVLHVVLHARWVALCWRRFIGTLRSPLSWLLLGVGIALLLLPIVLPHEHIGGDDQPQGRGRGFSNEEGRRWR